jgi:hypothetical protein
LKALIDPVYVVAVLPHGTIAPAWPVVPKSAPFVLPGPVDGADHARQFANQQHASYSVGQIRNMHPKIRVSMFSCPTPRVF